LPHAFREVTADPGATLSITATGPSGGQWTLTRKPNGWGLEAGEPDSPTTHVRLSDQNLWRLLFNALKGDAARAAVEIDGQPELAAPLLNARSIVV
jgi:hypothetical protein